MNGHLMLLTVIVLVVFNFPFFIREVETYDGTQAAFYIRRIYRNTFLLYE